MTTAIAPSSTKVPFFVLEQEDGQNRALFTVPSNLASSLVIHPILCRGSSFSLEIEKEAQTQSTFLSTVFYSPDPEETAKEIAERLAIRIGRPANIVSGIFGFWKKHECGGAIGIDLNSSNEHCCHCEFQI